MVEISDQDYQSLKARLKELETMIKISPDLDSTKNVQSEEELSLKGILLDEVKDSIFLHDNNGRFLYFNKAAYESRGYTKEELLGMNLHQLDVPETAKLIEPRIKELFDKGESTFESAHYKKDRSIMLVEVKVRILELNGKKLLLSIARDITDRKQAEEETAKKVLELKKMAKIMEDREDRIIELKNEVKDLKDRLSKT